jgi:aerobic-type carbon monoxide dehydrogenase small subunit (CoxS/CutS family)
MAIDLIVNGQPRSVDVEPDTPLLWVLRDTLGLTGTKYGCGRALCGSCTVHVDGSAVRACVHPISAAAGRSVTTIEGLGASKPGAAVQDAWVALDVVQCGWCQPGQCMAAAALLAAVPAPDDAAIDQSLAGNLCRCGTYPRIRKAVHEAARRLRAGAAGEGR